jgi:hypothetical protein
MDVETSERFEIAIKEETWCKNSYVLGRMWNAWSVSTLDIARRSFVLGFRCHVCFEDRFDDTFA